MTGVPASTYRLQLSEAFDFDAAAAVAPYVKDLGADWLYLSPILQSAEGSPHGYDVTDPGRIDHGRGGAAGFQRLIETTSALGLGVLVDIVPNHMGLAVPRENPWWWDVLTHGRSSPWAGAFDIDWDFGDGTVRIPVLGDEADPELRVEDGELCYHELRFPLAAGTADDGASVAVIAARQHYSLIPWRRADRELNYRRFFAVNSLAAIRVEQRWVFDASHDLVLGLVRDGLIDGLRIDHPDGLADPGQYLRWVAAATGDVFVVVEKILARAEVLPPPWAPTGTTGYDAMAEIDRVLIDPAGADLLDLIDRPGAEPVDWDDLVHDAKRAVGDGILAADVGRVARDLGLPDRADAVAELMACLPVYRTYLPDGFAHLERAAAGARRRRPDLTEAIDRVVAQLQDLTHPGAVRFQQTSGMVMAKGVEDCAFYRYNRLGSLTEVGGDPSEFSLGVEEFHQRQQARLADRTSSLIALTTHDTKRSEDVRARLDVLAEIPGEWATLVGELRRLRRVGDPALSNLLWQAVVGSWPASRERLQRYAEKAVREAGTLTSWTDPDDAFEDQVKALVDSVFDDVEVRSLIEAFGARIGPAGRTNALTAKLLQLTTVGIPDLYQGSELWTMTLADPDNRVAVDFDRRRDLLARLDTGERPGIDDEGAVKMLVTTRALRLRRDRPHLFRGYRPTPVDGPASNHLIGINRGGAVALGTRLPIGLEARGGWGDTVVELAAADHVDAFTGTAHVGGRRGVAELLKDYPVALLVADESR